MEKDIIDSVKLEALKGQIKGKIKSTYNMNVSEFSKTRVAKQLGVGKNLSIYLSNGSTSFPALEKLCRHFKLGELKREVVVERTYFYTLEPCE